MEMTEFRGEKVPATYLGDAVYVLYDGYSYRLRLNDHRSEEGQICLEPPVLNSLWSFATECNKLRMKIEDEREEPTNLATTDNKSKG